MCNIKLKIRENSSIKRLYHYIKSARLRTRFLILRNISYKHMSLIIKNLSVSLGEKIILKDVNLEILPGKTHVLMGPNGSGKSTLAQVLMGNPNYELGIKNYELRIDKKDITKMKPDERGREGLFLAFQNPVAIPGVNVANLLKMAYQLKKQTTDNLPAQAGKQQKPKDKILPTKTYNPALSVWEFNEMLVKKAKSLYIPQEFLRRSLNEQFSGGEKKKLEMLQAVVLEPKYAIFDEIDTGLDVDALKIVADGISKLKKQGTGVLLITHYQRILKFVKPDFVHILVGGKIAEEGDYKLAQEIEKSGYKRWVS